MTPPRIRFYLLGPVFAVKFGRLNLISGLWGVFAGTSHESQTPDLEFSACRKRLRANAGEPIEKSRVNSIRGALGRKGVSEKKKRGSGKRMP